MHAHTLYINHLHTFQVIVINFTVPTHTNIRSAVSI